MMLKEMTVILNKALKQAELMRKTILVLFLMLTGMLLCVKITYAEEEDDWYKQFDYSVNDERQCIYLSTYNGPEMDVNHPFTFQKEVVIGDKTYQVIATGAASDRIKYIKIEKGMKWSQLVYMLDYGTIDIADLTGIELDFEQRGEQDPVSFWDLSVRKVIIADTDASRLGADVFAFSTFFKDCKRLEEIEIRNVNLCNMKSVNNFISNCPELKKVTFDGVDLSGLQRIHPEWDGVYDSSHKGFIIEAPQLEEFNLKNCDLSCCESMELMFLGIAKKITIRNVKCDKLNDMTNMFYESRLSDLDIDDFDTTHVESMEGMFHGLQSLGKVVISGLQTDSVKNVSGMFMDCKTLEEIQFVNTDFKKSKIENMSQMFYKANRIKDVDLSVYNTDYVEGIEGMFYECYQLRTLDLSKMNLSKAKAGEYKFISSCPRLEILLAPKAMNENCITKLSPELHIYYPDGTLSYETYSNLADVPAGSILIKDYDSLPLLKEKYGIDYGMAGIRPDPEAPQPTASPIPSELPAPSATPIPSETPVISPTPAVTEAPTVVEKPAEVTKTVPTVKGVKVKREKQTKVKVTWKKASGIKGYKLQIATNKKFTKAKTILISNAKTTKKTLSRKKGQKIYIRICAYQRKAGKNVYGKYVVKSVKK